MDKAAVLAQALGEDPSKMMQQATESAKQAGFCASAKCTTKEIQLWARLQGSGLPKPLGAYAEALSGGHSDNHQAASAVAQA